jgi:hypothetical protein
VRALVLIAFVAVALLYVGPALLPDRYLAPLDIPRDLDAWKSSPAERVRVSNSLLSDVLTEFAAWEFETRRLLLHGELPWRNRYAGDGGPLFANPQTAMLFPLTWPRLAFGLRGWAVALLLKLVCGALGMYWLVRLIGGSRPEALLSGLVFMTSAYMVTTLLFAHTNLFVLLPYLAGAAILYLREPSRRAAALVVATAALATAGGHPETLMLGVCALVALLLWETRSPRRLVPILTGWAIGFLLLSVALFPFFKVLSQSYSQQIRTTTPTLGVRLTGMIGEVLPGFLGSPLRSELDFTGFLHVNENFSIRSIGYVGLITLVAIALSWKQLPVILRRGLIIGGVALVISFRPPGLHALLRHIPILGWVAIEYFAVIFVFFAGAAAGPALLRVPDRRRGIGVALVLSGALLFAAGILPSIPGSAPLLQRLASRGIEHLRSTGALKQPAEIYQQRLAYYLSAARDTALRRVALPGACWLAAGAALLLGKRGNRGAAGFSPPSAILAAAALVELIGFGVGFNPVVRRDEIAPLPPAVEKLWQLDPSHQWYVASQADAFPPNLGTQYQIREIVSYDFLMTAEQTRALMRAGYDPLLHTFPPILSGAQVGALRLLGVRYFISRMPVPGARVIPLSRPSAAGFYEIEGAAHVPMPANAPPGWLLAGLAVTLLAAVASVVYVRRAGVSAVG